MGVTDCVDGRAVFTVILVFSATLLCLAMALVLRGSVAGGAPTSFVGFDGYGVIVGFVAFIAASSVLGTIGGAALIISFLFHEAGHVLAYRMLGHQDTRFRMAPFLSGVAISDQPLKTEGDAFFVALMGPGLSLAPMVLAMTLSVALAQPAPELAKVLQIFGVTCAALNVVNLLPFWPLDGGHCARMSARNFWPGLAPGLTVFMGTAFFVAGIRTQSLALMIIGIAGFTSLLRKPDETLTPMGADNGLIALSAYAFTLAAHFCCAWPFVSAFF